MTELTMPRGLTGGQAERLRSWLLDQAGAAEVLAEELGTVPDPSMSASSHRAFLRGQADAWNTAERALRVASVGAL